MLSELTRHFQRQPLISRTSTDPASSRADDVGALGPRLLVVRSVPNVRRTRSMTLSQPTRPHGCCCWRLLSFLLILCLYACRSCSIMNQFHDPSYSEFHRTSFSHNNVTCDVDDRTSHCTVRSGTVYATTNKYPTQSDTALSLTLSHGRPGTGTGTWW